MLRELRRFKRISFHEAFHFQEEKGVLNGNCVAIDLSEGGVQLRVEEFFPLRCEFSVSFRLNDNADVLTLDSSVAWVQRVPHAEVYRVGLEFTESNGNCKRKKRIQKYIGK